MIDMRSFNIVFGSLAVALGLTLGACNSAPVTTETGSKPVTTNPGANPSTNPGLTPMTDPGAGAEAGPALPATPPTATTSSDGAWSNPATWGGSVPADGALVVIPTGKTVRLDTDTAFLSGLNIQGSLIFDDDKSLKLASRYVLIDGGLLQVGTDIVPHKNKAIITLTGTDEAVNVIGADTMRMGTKFLGTYMGNS